MSDQTNESREVRCRADTGTYDVVVIGGGPAGSAAATFLARRGARCLVLEQARFPRYHIGESLIPHAHGVFQRLGFLPQLASAGFTEKHGVRFVAPDGGRATPFRFAETVPGDAARTWQVDRARFDQMLLDHARDNGVEVREDGRVESVIFEGDQATGVAVRFGGEDALTRVAARVVVDASGRATLVGRQLGLKADVPGLNKGSAWSYYRGGKLWPGIDAGETTVFRVPGGGWFWYIPLPDDIVSVGIVADPDYLFGDGRRDAQAILEREVRRCAPLAERLSDARRTGPAIAAPRLAYMNTRTCGDGWVMVGDARAFLDPVYSSGVFLAVAGAELAAGCIADALGADDVSACRLGRFEPALSEGVEVIRRLIHAFYDPEFSFGEFARRRPDLRPALIDCLVGDVFKDMTQFEAGLAEMTAPPPPLFP